MINFENKDLQDLLEDFDNKKDLILRLEGIGILAVTTVEKAYNFLSWSFMQKVEILSATYNEEIGYNIRVRVKK